MCSTETEDHVGGEAKGPGCGLKGVVESRRYNMTINKCTARRETRRSNTCAAHAPGDQQVGVGACSIGRGDGGRACVGPPRIRPGMWLKVSTLNRQGMQVVAKREEVAECIDLNEVD